jgi:hypothetical protein
MVTEIAGKIIIIFNLHFLKEVYETLVKIIKSNILDLGQKLFKKE